MSTQEILITKINRTGGTQIRAEYCETTIKRYKEIWESRSELPPVIVFYDGTEYWLADGFHRIESKWISELPIPTISKKINCEVKPGTQKDAIAYALSANSEHGLPRSGGDIRRAIDRCLDDAEWGELSNVAIAKMCAVSEGMVRKRKSERNKPPAQNHRVDISSDRTVRSSEDAEPLGLKPTSADPETAEVGEILAIATPKDPDLLINKDWDAVYDLPNPVFEMPITETVPCDFKVGDRVINGEDHSGVVSDVFTQAGSWYLKVSLDTGYEEKGAVELYHLEPSLRQLLEIFYVLTAKKTNLVAIRGKGGIYSYSTLAGAIATGNIALFTNPNIAATAAGLSGCNIKKMVITVEEILC